MARATASERWAAEDHDRALRNDLYPTTPVVIADPHPDDFGGLARAVCRRALELEGEARARGLSLLEALVAAEEAADEWLVCVGYPAAEGDVDWTDDDDWSASLRERI